jgi:hypothetical protein
MFQEMNLQALSEERDSLSDDCDSGNDEPSDYFPLERGASNSNTPQVGYIYTYLLAVFRIHMFLIRINYHQAKTVRKTLMSTVL